MDQTKDYSCSVLYQILALHEVPQYVKTADAAALTGNSDLPARLYADPSHLEYPCHSAPATWMSAAYFLTEPPEAAKSAQEAIWSRIKAASRHFGIESYVDELAKTSEQKSTAKQAACANEDYMLLRDTAEGPVGHYAIRNSKEVCVAADYLHKYASRFPYAQRRQMATNLLLKASQLQVADDDYLALEPWLRRQAGFGFCSAKRACDLLSGRAKALARLGVEQDSQKRLRDAADLISKDASVLYDQHNLVAMAGWIDDLDRQHHLRDREGLPSVEETLFELNLDSMSKLASEHVGLPSGAVYKKTDLFRVPIEEVRKVLGEQKSAALAREIMPDPEHAVLFSQGLTISESRDFEKLAADHGVRPVHRVAARSEYRWQNNLSKLAQLAG